MRGTDRQTGRMFSYLSPETMVPQDHPLRVIRRLVDAALDRLSPAFNKLYSVVGRPSIPPEQLLQAFFAVRSERQLMEQLTYNMMFRWFVGLSMDAPVASAASPTPTARTISPTKVESFRWLDHLSWPAAD